MSKSGSAGQGRVALFLLVGMVLVMLVVAAAVVVVHNARRIQPVEVPVHLRPVKPDVGLRRFRASTRRRLLRIEERFERFRSRVPEPSPEQDSLATVIVDEFAGVRAELAAMDSIADQRELARRRGPLFERYRTLVNTVSRHARTVLAVEGPELDSLDRELERLLLPDN
jgi:hypothetical protein